MASDTRFTAPLRRWTGANGGSWYILTIAGSAAEALAGHALIRRLEEGRARGFGSVKVEARVDATVWLTSAFPQRDGTWVMLVKAQVRRAERLEEGDRVSVALRML